MTTGGQYMDAQFFAFMAETSAVPAPSTSSLTGKSKETESRRIRFVAPAQALMATATMTSAAANFKGREDISEHL